MTETVHLEQMLETEPRQPEQMMELVRLEQMMETEPGRWSR